MKFLTFLFVLFPSLSFATDIRESIRAKIQEHLADVRVCYSDSLEKNPLNEGTIVVNWDVNEAGAVTKVGVDEAKTTFKDKAVQTCITDKFKTWTFPAPTKGHVVSVTYPFTFSSKK